MKLSGTGTYVLDAITDEFTFKASVSNAPNTFFVVLKYRNEYDTIKLTYNRGTWSLDDGSVPNPTKSSYTKDGDYVITVKDDKLTFKIGTTFFNNTYYTTIFENENLSYKGNGKIGFALTSSSSSITIDNVSYVGNGKVNSGVNYGAWATAEMGHTS